MDEGRVVEFDRPGVLSADANSRLSVLLRELEKKQ